MRPARRTASTSSSARWSAFEPAAFTWAPGAIQRPSSTGVLELVIVMRIEASRAATSGRSTATTGTPSSALISSAKRARRSGSRP